MLKAIIFDLRETIGTKNIWISKTLSNHFNIENTPDFLEKYEKAIQLKKFDDETELSKSFLEIFQLEQSEDNILFVKNLLQSWIEKASLFKGMPELLKKLSKSYKLGVLSNTTCFESKVLENFKIKQFFECQAFSRELGTIKPDFNNFYTICQKLNIQWSEGIFIDDWEKNVKAAKEFWLQAIQFKSVEILKEELTKFGIKI